MTTCGKCGAANVAGDAFCGNCGAFLEFAAEEAAETAADENGVAGSPGAPPPDAGPVPVASPLPIPSPPPTPTGGAGEGAAGSGAVPAPAPGPICGACGRQNPAGRTFCVSCGERLETGSGARVVAGAAAGGSGPVADGGQPAAGAGAPAPKGPTQPTWDFPTAPVPTPAPKPATRPSPADTGGGSRLPLIAGLVVVLVLVGGAAAFVVSGGLGGGGSTPATASPEGSGAAVATPDATPVTPAPATAQPTAPPAPPTPAPATVPPGPAVGLKVTSSAASTQLAAGNAAKYLHDGSPASAWLGKAGDLGGAWIEVGFAPAAVTRIQLWGGWQRDEPRYRGNHRPHNVTVSFDGGDPVPLELKDLLGAQRVDIPPELGIVGATSLRITIVDTYASKKTSAKGSPSKSVAVSEVRLFGVPVTP